VYRSSSSEKGLPDIAGSYKGTFIAIEVKSKRGKPTVEQVQFLEQIKLTGGIAGVARSIEDVQKIILSHLDRSPQKKEQAPEVVRQESICP
jgi:Holliday junction resolvase